MNVVMLTPLFPPDTSNSARYVKLLAAKLEIASLTLIAYGRLPESVPGVQITNIDKSGSKLSTIYHCIQSLISLKPTTLIVHNGPSTELPALLYLILRPTTNLMYIESDSQAALDTKNILFTLIRKNIKKRARTTITLPQDTSSYLPEEKLPFSQTDEHRELSYKDWWEKHLKEILSYVR